MSTRANIVVKDAFDKLFFYRHSDGYPDGAMPVLKEFLNHVKSGAIRDNVSQASGWLIYLGAKENGFQEPSVEPHSGWKVGSIEPATEISGDIEYLYIVDLDQKTIECHDSWDSEGNGENKIRIN